MEKFILILIIIFIIVSILFSVSLVLQIYNHLKFKKRNDCINEKTKMCFECGYHFNFNDQNNFEFIYCPFCGKKVFGFDDESFNRFDKEYNKENLQNESC